MASGITNKGRQRIINGQSWGGTNPRFELITEVYNSSQIDSMTLGSLALAAGGNYVSYKPFDGLDQYPNIDPSNVSSAISGNYFIMKDIMGQPITYPNLTTDGAATIKGYAYCVDSDVIYIHEITEFTPNGTTKTIPLVDNIYLKFNINTSEYPQAWMFSNALPISSADLTWYSGMRARLVTAEPSVKFSSSIFDWTVATGGNYTFKELTGFNVVQSGRRWILDADDITWTALTTDGTPLIGILFHMGVSGAPVAYHKFAVPVTPNGNDFTYSFGSNGILYIG